MILQIDIINCAKKNINTVL